MAKLKILPGTGRGTAERSSVVEGAPSVSLRLPPHRSGEDLLSYSRAYVHGRRMTISTHDTAAFSSAAKRLAHARTRRAVNIVNFRAGGR
jgi:hypothetical protein